ncbi:hypothetical protein EV702DRAFT_977385, partial [Suillus placidus]
IDEKQWCPFRSCADFEFSEIALDAALNKHQIDALLNLILCISQGHTEITLKNEADLSKAWDNAAAELTPVCLNFDHHTHNVAQCVSHYLTVFET